MGPLSCVHNHVVHRGNQHSLDLVKAALRRSPYNIMAKLLYFNFKTGEASSSTRQRDLYSAHVYKQISRWCERGRVALFSTNRSTDKIGRVTSQTWNLQVVVPGTPGIFNSISLKPLCGMALPFAALRHIVVSARCNDTSGCHD